MERDKSCSPCKTESEDSLPKFDIFGYDSETTENHPETDLEEKEHSKPDIVVPQTFLSTVSMPKNWSQVEKLKQKRSLLHEKLFGQKLNVEKNGNSKLQGTDIHDSVQNKSIQSVIENKQPATEANLIQRIEGNIDSDKLGNSKVESCRIDDENFDLSKITASKINENFRRTISSVRKCTKEECHRIKKVLKSIKSKSQELSSMNSDIKEYHIPKLSVSDGDITKDSLNKKDTISNGLKEENHSEKPLIHEAKNATNISEIESTKYVGLPVNFSSMSQSLLNLDNNIELSKSKGSLISNDDGHIKSPSQTSSKGSVKSKESFDYKNIALQKLKAEQRLKEISKLHNTDTDNGDIKGTASDESIKDDVSLDYANIAFQKYLAEQRLKESQHTEKTDLKETISETVEHNNSAVMDSLTSQAIHVDDAAKLDVNEVNDKIRGTTNEVLETISHLKHAVSKRKEHSNKAKEFKQQVLKNLKAKQESKTRQKSPATEHKKQMSPFRQFMKNRSEKENSESDSTISDNDVWSDDVDEKHADPKRVGKCLNKKNEEVICDNKGRKTMELNENKANEKQLNINSQLEPQNDLMSTNASKKGKSKRSSSAGISKRKKTKTQTKSESVERQKDANAVPHSASMGGTSKTLPSTLVDSNGAAHTVNISKTNEIPVQQIHTTYWAPVGSGSLKSDTTAILQSRQDLASQSVMVAESGEVILPVRPIDVSSKKYNSLNGQPCVMIDGQLYQANLKVMNGKIFTVLGDPLPTTCYKEKQNSQTVVGNQTSKATSSVPNKPTSHVQPTSITVGSNRYQLQPAGATSLYRFPVSCTALQNAKLRANQPVNLLFVPHSQNINSQYSLIRVPRSSVQTRTVTNNLLRLPVNVAVSQNSGLVLSDKSVKSMVTTVHSTLPKTTLSLSKSPMQASAINKNHVTTVNSTVLASAASQRSSDATSSGQKDTVGSLVAKYRCISPRNAKSLFTNQTYRCYDSLPVVNSLTSVPSATSANQLTAAYIGSVVLGSQQMNTSVSSSGAHAKPINCVQNSDVKTRAKSASAKSDHSTPTTEKVISEMKELDGNSCTQNDAVKPNTGNNSYDIKTSPSAYFYSSMDTLSSMALPKDKGNRSLQEKMPLEKGLEICTEDINKHSSNMERTIPGEGETTEKSSNPLPFLDYPARIVSNKMSNNGSKIVVPSPRRKGKSGSDTSLDEEKMAKMIAFAQEIEEESATRKTINEQKHLNRRQSQGKSSKTNGCLDSSTKNKESEISADIEVEGKNSSQNSEKLVTQMNDKPDGDRKNSESVKSIKELDSQNGSYRNVFADLKDSPPTNKLHIALSNDESADSYDSSDVESYEKFVAGRKVNSNCLKRKSVLIDSYFTSQGLSDMKKYNIEPKPSYPLAGIYSTSECSSKIIEDSSNSKNNSLNVAAKKSELKSLSSSKIADSLKTDSVAAKMKITSNSDLRITKNSTTAGTTVLPKAACPDKQQSGDGQSSCVGDGNKNPKRFIKTKFIILKGEICDRWFEVKKKTGYGEMSDPKFIQYLLRLEEERQNKMSQPLMSTPKLEPVEDVESSYELLRFSPLVIAQDGAADINNNNNNNWVLRQSQVNIEEDAELSSDLEDTIVNVTDTPPNSPFLRNQGKPDNCQVCLRSSSEVVSEDKKDKDLKCDSTPGTAGLDVERAKTVKGQCAKRSAEEMDDLESPASKKKCSVLSDATQKHIDRAVRLFREWLQKRGDSEDFENKSSPWLDDRLAHFYVEARTQDRRPYTADFLQMFRRALSLYLAASGKNVQVSISHDIEFYRSNQILAGLLKTQYSTKQWEPSEWIKSLGAVEVASKTNISEQEKNLVYAISGPDFEKLYSTRTLSDDNPTCLLWKVWFDITYHLCKGKISKHFWRSLKKQSLKLKSDVNGVFYTFTDYIPIDEEPGRMYATPNEPEKCPVRTTSLYLSKLCANCDSLFQVPKMSWSEGIDRWYLPVPLSSDKLDKIMCAISEHANLSVVYNTFSVLLTAKVRGLQSK